ncbi:MAG: VOC family protein [Gemmatimonadales bacterium]
MTAPAGRRQTEDRLPAELRLGPVGLVVSDLRRSETWYRDVIGLEPIDRAAGRASLGVGNRVLLELREEPGAVAAPGRLGLYHFAVLLPDRSALGGLVRRLVGRREPFGASDHLVSEALYLRDPDGLGVEVYADRPRSAWRWREGEPREVAMATEPLDLAAVAEAAAEPWRGAPGGTAIGHLHLHVGSLEEARAYYERAVGFEVTVSGYPGALFLSAGGYHHHLGLNTWAGPAARPARVGEARLDYWTIELPREQDVARVEARIAAAGFGRGDPWGTVLELSASSG